MLIFSFCLFFAFICVILSMGDYMSIGERIKKARKEAGLTQAQLADRLGVSAAMVSQYETGARTPKVETLKRISNALNIDVQNLIYNNYAENILKTAVPVAEGLQQALDNLSPGNTSRIPDNLRSQIIDFSEYMDSFFSDLDSDEYVRGMLEQKYIALLERLNALGIVTAIRMISELLENPKYSASKEN